MQVTLNVEPSVLKETLEETLKTLPSDLKEKIAVEVFKDFLQNHLYVSQQEALKVAYKNFKTAKGSSYFNGAYYNTWVDVPFEVGVKHHEFRNWYEHNPATLKDQIALMIAEEATVKVKDEVVRSFKENEDTKKFVEKITTNIEKNLPQIIEKALVAQFLTMFRDTVNMGTSALAEASLLRTELDSLKEQLLAR